MEHLDDDSLDHDGFDPVEVDRGVDMKDVLSLLGTVALFVFTITALVFLLIVISSPMKYYSKQWDCYWNPHSYLCEAR